MGRFIFNISLLMMFYTSIFSQQVDSVINVCFLYLKEFKMEYSYYSICQRINSIPTPLVNHIEKIDKISFNIAKPNRNFSRTDVVRRKNLPDKRMTFISNFENNWIFVFEQGGFAYRQRFIICEIIEGELNNYCEYAIMETVTNIEQLVKYINTDSFHSFNP
jgi:hypothetical protein